MPFICNMELDALAASDVANFLARLDKTGVELVREYAEETLRWNPIKKALPPPTYWTPGLRVGYPSLLAPIKRGTAIATFLPIIRHDDIRKFGAPPGERAYAAFYVGRTETEITAIGTDYSGRIVTITISSYSEEARRLHTIEDRMAEQLQMLEQLKQLNPVEPVKPVRLLYRLNR